MPVKVQVRGRVYQPAKRIKKKLKAEGEKLGRGFDKFIAEKIVETAKAGILEQRWRDKWKPLSPSYLEWKKRKGLDTRILIATGQYLDSFKVYRSGKYWVAGVEKDRLHYFEGKVVKIGDLAKWLEFGTRKMPPRPHWRPAFDYVSKNIRYFWNAFIKGKGW
jgi:hypothetical protein